MSMQTVFSVMFTIQVYTTTQAPQILQFLLRFQSSLGTEINVKNVSLLKIHQGLKMIQSCWVHTSKNASNVEKSFLILFPLDCELIRGTMDALLVVPMKRRMMMMILSGASRRGNTNTLTRAHQHQGKLLHR